MSNECRKMLKFEIQNTGFSRTSHIFVKVYVIYNRLTIYQIFYLLYMKSARQTVCLIISYFRPSTSYYLIVGFENEEIVIDDTLYLIMSNVTSVKYKCVVC